MPAHVAGDAGAIAWANGVDAAVAGKLDSTVASSTYGRRWQPLTTYALGDVVTTPTGELVTAIAGFTSGASYVAANWKLSVVPAARSRIRSAVKMDGTDQSAILNAEIAAMSAQNGGTIELPGSALPITCNTSITLADGVTIAGAGMSPTSGGPSRFDFSALATGQNCFNITDGSDIILRDFYVKGWTAGGAGAVIQATGRRITTERVTINAVTTGAGISFGATGSVIVSSIKGCVVVGCGYGFYIGAACTSVNLDNCYANLNTVAGYQIYGTYITLSSCASDGNTLYGYAFQNAVGVTLLSCGAEDSGRTGFFLAGASGITLASCRTVNSNTAALATVPSFADISNSSNYVTLIGCTDTTPNAATSWSVTYTSGTPGTSFTAINCGGLVKLIHPAVVNRTVVGASSAVGGAGLNVPHGVAPTTPVNGDMWTTTAGLFVRINGVTVGPLT